MNIFYKLFIVKGEKNVSNVVYGYALETYNQTRKWGEYKIDKKLKLYKLTCVMEEKKSLEFQQALISNEEILLTEDFIIKGEWIKRPDTIMYPKKDFNENNENILKFIVRMEEYWNLDKGTLFKEIQGTYGNDSARVKREKIHGIIEKISKETSINFFGNAAERLGNIDIYNGKDNIDKFKYEIKKVINKNSNESLVSGVKIEKSENVEFDIIVNCILNNAERCILNEIKEMKKKDRILEFEAKEEISKIELSIWNKETGKLIYKDSADIIRTIKTTINIADNIEYKIYDEWSNKLEKTFGGNKEKVEEIREVNYKGESFVSEIGYYKNDPWYEAGNECKRIVDIYRYEKMKGAFCKKIGQGEGEIDSFHKIIEYLNCEEVSKAIIVDPYFSIKAMQKFLARIENKNLNLEIITSLSSIDPDEKLKKLNLIDEIKNFLERNFGVIHKNLKIINITKNKNTAIHDRYLLRLLKNGSVDGYLLSNSLNSAGQNYNFVIAAMDKEVTFSILEYVDEIKDENIQASKHKLERLEVEVLWDESKKGYEESICVIPEKAKWEKEIQERYDSGKILVLDELFYDGWNLTDEIIKEAILKLAWYLYYDKEKIRGNVIEFIANKIGNNKFLSICNEIMIELEEREKEYEKNKNFQKEMVKYLRDVLSNKEEIKFDFKYLMENGYIEPIFYKVSKYAESLYEIIYEINSEELVRVMEIAKSPKAFEILYKKMIGNNYLDLKVYNKLFLSESEGIKEWGYYYYNFNAIRNIMNGKVIDIKEIDDISKENYIYQYASCINAISIKISKRELSVEAEKILKIYIKKLSELIEKDINFDREKTFKLLDGCNEIINYKNYELILENILNEKYRGIFLQRMIDGLKYKWEKQGFFNEKDLYILECSAGACFEYWNNNVEFIFKELKLNNKDLYVATEPGKYDMNYNEWHDSMLKVLYQIIFLEYYKKILESMEMNNDESYQKIDNKLRELDIIRKEFNKVDSKNDLDKLIQIVLEYKRF